MTRTQAFIRQWTLYQYARSRPHTKLVLNAYVGTSANFSGVANRNTILIAMRHTLINIRAIGRFTIGVYLTSHMWKFTTSRFESGFINNKNKRNIETDCYNGDKDGDDYHFLRHKSELLVVRRVKGKSECGGGHHAYSGEQKTGKIYPNF
jgi:hypothetical protein